MTQDGADEGRLNDTELAFHEGEDLQSNLNADSVYTICFTHSDDQFDTVRAFKTRQCVEVIKIKLQLKIAGILTHCPASKHGFW